MTLYIPKHHVEFQLDASIHYGEICISLVATYAKPTPLLTGRGFDMYQIGLKFFPITFTSFNIFLEKFRLTSILGNNKLAI